MSLPEVELDWISADEEGSMGGTSAARDGAPKALPEWVAPAGTLRPDVVLGTRVRFSAELVKWSDYDDRMPTWAGWKRANLPERVGMVVGIRFPYSGKYTRSKSPTRLATGWRATE